MSSKGLTQGKNTLVQFQLIITSKVSNSLDPYLVRTECRPDLGPNCLKRLSADDNVMLKLNTKLKFICSISTCHILLSKTVLTPIRSRQNVRPDLGLNCLKWLSAGDNVMLKLNAKLKCI